MISETVKTRGGVSSRALVWACLMAAALPLNAVAAEPLAEPPLPQAAPRAVVDKAPPGGRAAAPVAPAAPVQSPAIPERGIHRSALLINLLGGQPVLPLEPRADQPPDVVEALRLDESVAFALKNNFEVLASQAKTDASDWEVVGAYGAYLPSVTFTRAVGTEYSAPASYNNPVTGDRMAEDKHIRRDKTLMIRQPIIDLTLISDILLRHGRQTATELEQVGTQERVALQTVNTFFKIIRAQLSMRFAQDYKVQLDKLTEMMGSRVEGGGAAQADLDRIKTRTVNAQSAIIETRSEYDSAVDEFRRLTGVMPMKLEIPASLVPTPPESVDIALEKSLRANPEYRLSQHQIDVQRRERDKSYSRLLPKLSLDFTKNRTWNAGGAALGEDPASDSIFPYQNETRTMLTTTWSINGGTEIAEGLAAQAKAREANFKSLDTRNRTEEAVRLSFNALNAAQSRVGVLEQALDSNAKVVAAFQEQYFNASRPLFDLLDAYERQYSARLDLTRLLTAEAQAGHQLRRQMGELVPALKESEPRATPAAAQ